MATEQESHDRHGDEAGPDWREFIAVLLVSITAVLTAWSGFQASKWGGEMSIAFSEASAARIDAGRLEGEGNRKVDVQVGLFTQWLQAFQAGDEELAAFLAEVFPEPLASVFPEWAEARLAGDPSAPVTPFDSPEYVVEEQVAAEASEDRAEQRFADALENNQRSDNYTVLTVVFATVLFFGAISGRLRSRRNQWLLLGFGIAGFVIAVGVLLSFPIKL